uniref:Kinase n=1 Tax=Echeneis naucrates TaxID=173247 RepID=A0A665TVB8_ECHNA
QAAQECDLKCVSDLGCGASSPVPMTPKKSQQWLQVVGHAGSFHVGDYGRLLKRFCKREQQCYLRLMKDALRPFVPEYHGVVQLDKLDYNMMDNLLTHFITPAIMDCKIGSRYDLSESICFYRRSKEDKYTFYSSNLPKEFVVFQYNLNMKISIMGTQSFSNRICQIKKKKECHTNFKRTKSREQVMKAFDSFVESSTQIVWGYLRQLKQLRQVLETSDFFRTHEVVGSSLLFVHDWTGRTGVWMIDFGKTVILPPHLTLDHRTPWAEGNREDGYLWGLDNLIDILANMLPT